MLTEHVNLGYPGSPFKCMTFFLQDYDTLCVAHSYVFQFTADWAYRIKDKFTNQKVCSVTRADIYFIKKKNGML